MHYKVWKCGKQSTAANSDVGVFASAWGEWSALGGIWVDLEMEQVDGYLVDGRKCQSNLDGGVKL